MKLFTLIALLFFSATICIKAQIPNPDFENWTNGDPDGWHTDNIPGSIVTISQTSVAQSGGSALKGEVVSFQGVSVAPFLASINTNGHEDISVNQRYASLKGYYKFAPVQDDSLELVVTMYANGNTIGGGVLNFSPASSYTQFTANINYFTSETPDSALIVISIKNQAGSPAVHPGSVMYLDNISFSNVTAIDNAGTTPAVFKLNQNYPNPFNPLTIINYSLPGNGFAKLVIYNILGQSLKTLVNSRQASGSHSVNTGLLNLASGIYIYRLSFTGENGRRFTSEKKMILMK